VRKKIIEKKGWGLRMERGVGEKDKDGCAQILSWNDKSDFV